MTEINELAHRTKAWDIDDFYRAIYGVKEITTEREKMDFEAWYFAMCLLLPKESFLQKVELLGGMNAVISDSVKKNLLARFFKVEPRLVMVRIKDILSQQEHQTEEIKCKKLSGENKKL